MVKRRRGPVVARYATARVPARSSAAAFCRALASARRAAGLTQAELADKLGTTQSAIARLEGGQFAATVKTLSRLSNVLGVHFEVIPQAGLAVRFGPSRAVTLAELTGRRDELLQIAARHGARDVRVFGSVARGDARPDSDVDFLVVFEPGRTVLDLSALILDLEEALGRRVDVVEVPRQSRIAARMRREAVPL